MATGHLSYPLSTHTALKTLSKPQSPQGASSPQSLTVCPALLSACEGLRTRPWLTHLYRGSRERQARSQAPKEPASAYASPPVQKSGSKETSGKSEWVACISPGG